MYRIYELGGECDKAELLDGHEYADLESARVATDLLQREKYKADVCAWPEDTWPEDTVDDYEAWLSERCLSIFSGGYAWTVDKDGKLQESDYLAAMLADLIV